MSDRHWHGGRWRQVYIREVAFCAFPVTAYFTSKKRRDQENLYKEIIMTIRIQQSSFELLPTGEYPAIVDNIEYDDGRFGQQLRWRFVLKGRHDGRVLTGWTSPTFSINSKLYAWCKAALGGSPIPKGQAFDSDSIIGRKVELVVIQRNGDNGTYNRIEEVRSIKPEAPHSSGDSDNPF